MKLNTIQRKQTTQNKTTLPLAAFYDTQPGNEVAYEQAIIRMMLSSCTAAVHPH